MILLIGGTTEARIISDYFNKQRINYFYCSATPVGASLVNTNFVSSKRLNEIDLKELVINNGITHIIDLSHPYAIGIKENANKVAEELGIPYIFYIRPASEVVDDRIIHFKEMEQIVEFCSKRNGNVLLTTGTNGLDKWQDFDKNRLFIRTLPVISSIEKCDEVGIKPKNIVAMFGPFSYEENLLICKRLHIQWLVTKESGEEGGYKNKVQAALDLGIIPLVLDRPEIQLNGIKFNSFNLLIDYVKKEIN